MRAVIVEDEMRARRLIRNLLQAVDPLTQIVGECANGQEGLEIICEKLPDVVFADIRMPEMSGLEMIRLLKQKRVHTEFVMLTGYSDFQYAKESIDLGVSGYILKPVTYEDISRELAKIYTKLGGSNPGLRIEKDFSFPAVHEIERRCTNILVKRAIRYVNEHMRAPCRLAQTARELVVSPEHLSRVFHLETGMKYTDYVRLVKIDYAMLLLRKTQLKVQEISLMAGMENDKYFHNIFKETAGVTPKRYRMIARDGTAAADAFAADPEEDA